MTAQVMVMPSTWIDSGIELRPVRDRILFKFTRELQERLDELTDKRQDVQLSGGEEAELAGILELDRIFTLLNAKLITQS